MNNPKSAMPIEDIVQHTEDFKKIVQCLGEKEFLRSVYTFEFGYYYDMVLRKTKLFPDEKLFPAEKISCDQKLFCDEKLSRDKKILRPEAAYVTIKTFFGKVDPARKELYSKVKTTMEIFEWYFDASGSPELAHKN